MRTLKTEPIPSEQLDALEEFAESTAGPELRDLLLSLSRCVRDGDDVIAVGEEATLTPRQVAERLGMSRTHLYKLLDREEIPSFRVGRDRRVRVRDLVEFEKQHQRDGRELAERFAHQTRTAAGADAEIAELL